MGLSGEGHLLPAACTLPVDHPVKGDEPVPGEFVELDSSGPEGTGTLRGQSPCPPLFSEPEAIVT